MMKTQMPLLWCLLSLQSVAQLDAQSLSNCGKPTDHLSNVKYVLSPDPIQRGQAFSITMSGTIDEDLASGFVHVDAEVKALGVINKKINKNAAFKFSPALLQKGDVSLVVGPTKIPSGLPGSAMLKGQISIMNAKNESVACVALDFNVPLFAAPDSDTAPLIAPEPVATCTKAADHLKDLVVTVDNATGVASVTGTLDEDVSTCALDIDLKIHELFSIPFKMQVPIAIKPGFKKGALAWSFTSEDTNQLSSSSAPKVTGTVVLNDAAGQEILCLNAPGGPNSASASEVVV